MNILHFVVVRKEDEGDVRRRECKIFEWIVVCLVSISSFIPE